MTAPQDMTKPTPSGSAVAETSNIYKEGIVAGLLGAVTIAIWFFMLDAIQGRPLYTPTVLGTALFRARAGLSAPESLPATFELVLWFTWVHVLVFVVLGVAAAVLLRLAERDPNFGFGLWALGFPLWGAWVRSSTGPEACPQPEARNDSTP